MNENLHLLIMYEEAKKAYKEARKNKTWKIYAWYASLLPKIQTIAMDLILNENDYSLAKCLPKHLKDEEFLDESTVWCGAGEHKFQTDKFLKEQQLYA